MASVVQMMLMIHMAKRFPFVASLFHKIFRQIFVPRLHSLLSFLSFYLLFLLLILAHFGNLSGLDYVHPQPTKPCFSVSKRPPLTEKRRLLPCGLLPAWTARLCATPHLVTSARQPQVAPAGGKGEQGNHNVPSAALTELQFPVSVFKGS